MNFERESNAESSLPERAPEELKPEISPEITISESEISDMERKKRSEFLDQIQKEEQEMAGGILSGFREIPKSIKRVVMMLAVVGTLLSASEVFAGDSFGKSYEGWQKHFGQKGRVESVQNLEKQRQAAHSEYKMRAMQIQQDYEQYKIRAMMEQPHNVRGAMQKLEEWRQRELAKARLEWMTKSWTAEEEYRLKISQ